MAKNKTLRFATVLAAIFTAIMVNNKPTCSKNENKKGWGNIYGNKNTSRSFIRIRLFIKK